MRSYKRITPADLRVLASIARKDRENFFERNPRWLKYSQRLCCVALCQGGGLHFANNTTGVKDFDVWSFFCELPRDPIPRRPVVHRDFGHIKFGKSPDRQDFIGRRVDLILKSIPYTSKGGFLLSLKRYLAKGRTQTARFLAEKAVVLIEPAEFEGVIVWPE
jgi:hypothetical protein